MRKITRNNLSDIWNMRNLSVKNVLTEISKHPDLKFFITAAGFWWFTCSVVAITISANVIYYVFRIFRLVLG
jgi:hypothetical protein